MLIRSDVIDLPPTPMEGSVIITAAVYVTDGITFFFREMQEADGVRNTIKKKWSITHSLSRCERPKKESFFNMEILLLLRILRREKAEKDTEPQAKIYFKDYTNIGKKYLDISHTNIILQDFHCSRQTKSKLD